MANEDDMLQRLQHMLQSAHASAFVQQGLCTLDTVATQAMAKIMETRPESSPEFVTKLAWQYADLMMQERRKRVGERESVETMPTASSQIEAAETD